MQVDLLKDQVEEVEEQNSLILKELRAKSHDYELLKRDHEESKRAVQLLQAALQDHQAMVKIIIIIIIKIYCSVVDPGCLSRIRLFSIPDPRSRILIKEFKYFNPKKIKKWFLSS